MKLLISNNSKIKIERINILLIIIVILIDAFKLICFEFDFLLIPLLFIYFYLKDKILSEISSDYIIGFSPIFLYSYWSHIRFGRYYHNSLGNILASNLYFLLISFEEKRKLNKKFSSIILFFIIVLIR